MSNRATAAEWSRVALKQCSGTPVVACSVERGNISHNSLYFIQTPRCPLSLGTASCSSPREISCVSEWNAVLGIESVVTMVKTKTLLLIHNVFYLRRKMKGAVGRMWFVFHVFLYFLKLAALPLLVLPWFSICCTQECFICLSGFLIKDRPRRQSDNCKCSMTGGTN